MKFKKLLCAAMAATTILSCVGINASLSYSEVSAEVYSANGYTLEYEVNGSNDIAISGYTGTPVNIEIPDTIGNYNVTSIVDGAFNKCTSLESINIGNKVSVIGSAAFSGCSALKSITVSADNQNYTAVNGVLFNKTKTTLIKFPSAKTGTYTAPTTVTTLGDMSFEGCNAITSINLTDSVLTIGNNAFYNATSLTSVTMGSKVNKIGTYAFSGCSNLESIYVSSDNQSFCTVSSVLFNKNQTNLISYPSKKSDTSYSLPDSVTTITNNAFSETVNLKTVELDNNLTSIGQYAFYKSSIQEINLPESITFIDEGTFSNCLNLSSVTMSNNVTVIGNYAFNNCSSLSNISLSNSLKTIGNYCFCRCSLLTDLTIPDTVTSIGMYVFSYCSGLVNIKLSNNLSSLENDVFYLCTGLKSIVIPDSVTSIKQYAFMQCTSLNNVKLGSGVNTIETGAFAGCTALHSIFLSQTVTTFGVRALGYLNSYSSSKISSFVIVGYKGSAAETYAVTNDITFIDVTKMGDVDYNGTVNVNDLILLKQYIFNKTVITDEQKVYADVNTDGVIDSLDVAALKMRLL